MKIGDIIVIKRAESVSVYPDIINQREMINYSYTNAVVKNMHGDDLVLRLDNGEYCHVKADAVEVHNGCNVIEIGFLEVEVKR